MKPFIVLLVIGGTSASTFTGLFEILGGAQARRLGCLATAHLSWCSVVQCVVPCCSVLQSVVVCCSVSQCLATAHLLLPLSFSRAFSLSHSQPYARIATVTYPPVITFSVYLNSLSTIVAALQHRSTWSPHTSSVPPSPATTHPPLYPLVVTWANRGTEGYKTLDSLYSIHTYMPCAGLPTKRVPLVRVTMKGASIKIPFATQRRNGARSRGSFGHCLLVARCAIFVCPTAAGWGVAVGRFWDCLRPLVMRDRGVGHDELPCLHTLHGSGESAQRDMSSPSPHQRMCRGGDCQHLSIVVTQ